MRTADWLKKSKKLVDSLDAELILIDALGLRDRSELILREQEPLANEVVETIDTEVGRRQKGEPLAYILGRREFYGYNFDVSPGVLIPRPETEVMIDLALDYIRFDDMDAEKEWLIYDIGTGSGCIAISMALELSKMSQAAWVFACDESNEALKMAEKNYHKLKNTVVQNEKIKFNCVQSDLLGGLKLDIKKPTIVMANLPYVSRDWEWVDKETLKYEPESALFAEDNGLALIKKLIGEFSERFAGAKNAFLMLESDLSQIASIENYAQICGLKLVKEINYITVFILE